MRKTLPNLSSMLAQDMLPRPEQPFKSILMEKQNVSTLKTYQQVGISVRKRLKSMGDGPVRDRACDRHVQGVDDVPQGELR